MTGRPSGDPDRIFGQVVAMIVTGLILLVLVRAALIVLGWMS